MLTVGHGTLEQAELGSLLRNAGVDVVVDVRRFPGSRRWPHVAREALAQWLPTYGVAYDWVEDLGGRRSVAKDSPHVALRNDAFRGYADHMETQPFRAALQAVVDRAAQQTLAVMCSESVWWRCHRRLIADAATLLHDAQVRHLMHDGRLTPHAPTDGVRRHRSGLRYDVGVQQPLDGLDP